MSDNAGQRVLVYAIVSGIGADSVDKDEDNNPVKRRLNRVDRVIAAYQGEVVDRSPYSYCAAFRTADTAVLAACEMQHRCSSLPQQFKRHVSLRVGIHPESDTPNAANENAEGLAVLDNGIVASENVIAASNPELHALASPLKAPSIDIPVFSVDWRLEIPMGVMNGDLIVSTPVGDGQKNPKPAKAKSVFLKLSYKEKKIELTRDIPVVSLGRDPQNDLVFENDFLVSRNHCRIEWRAGRLVLTDTSTNGTSVTDEHGKEVLIRKSSIDISGKGLILLGRTFPGDLGCGVHFETC
ncbi:MAG: FHA domain-containing protein [Candidatus Accumulibacter sp.]|jgi:hypothetical protein|nr:FHA domain-containing protein [Accumulibacter sp.]